MATIPPWIVTPDAAGRYVQGFGLGLDVAQRRAAQAVQQQQMALQVQNMEQARQTAAQNAARQAIALQMEQQFRSAKLAADANALAQAKTLADAARKQAATLARERIAGGIEEAKIRSAGGTTEPLTAENIKQFPIGGDASIVSAPGMSPRVVSSGGKRSISEYITQKQIDQDFEVLSNPNSTPEEVAAAQARIDAAKVKPTERLWKFED